MTLKKILTPRVDKDFFPLVVITLTRRFFPVGLFFSHLQLSPPSIVIQRKRKKKEVNINVDWRFTIVHFKTRMTFWKTNEFLITSRVVGGEEIAKRYTRS